jgi:hypothetical protein
VSDANYDPGDVDLIVGGRVIDGASGITGFDSDRAPTPVMARGRRRIGFNRQRNANGADFTIVVSSVSTDLEYLEALVASQTEVPVKAVVTRNLDSYAVGQRIAIGCQFGVLGGGRSQLGNSEDADDIEFSVTGRGRISESKKA